MPYQLPPANVHMKPHRASTAPSSPAIPPSLIPGYRYRQAISTSGGLLFSGPSHSPTATVPASPLPVNDFPEYYSLSPSSYRDHQQPPFLPQSLALSRQQQQQQLEVPPLPPKTPILRSSPSSPTLPPKPSSFIPSPTTVFPPKASPRSKSQPNIAIPRSASPPPSVPNVPLPPPPILPPKPLGARSRSFVVTSNRFPAPNVGLSAHPSLSAKAPRGTDDTAPRSLPSETPPVQRPLGLNEEDELEMALELSAHAEREHANSLLSQDEELARALEESLLDSAPQPVLSRSQPGPSYVGSESIASSSSTRPWDAHSHSPKPNSHVSPPLPVQSSLIDEQLKEDEELARKLEAEYESGRTTPTSETNQDVEPKPSLAEYSSLPRYAEIVEQKTSTPVKPFESDATASPRVSQALPASVHADERLPTSDQANIPPRNSPSPVQSTSPRLDSPTIAPSPPEEEEATESSSVSQPLRAFVTPNQLVGPELLYGVSFGFHTPPMENLMMRGPLPNIIALPYGKCPPVHIRAPSWRQLLKLMAKLSATQIEPSVEAVAVTKGELQLRTVVQFFRLHQSSRDWRMVIYLTIDYPPPPDHRATSGDVNVLPYSYGLSSLPALLRDGPESQISKYYTIPATPRTPLPKLPITMPSMAMYLASALEDSRRALGDSSSGVRRLAKMIDQFYPNPQGRRAAGEEEERRRGGRALIGRLMGRTSKPPQGRHNAEVYDLVTPFVPDEWG